MKKRVADILLDVLIENSITDCFSVVGGGAMHLNNAFALRDEVHKIFCHHEQACAMAAEAYARATDRLAAVCVTSGPGGLNTLNGVEGAWADSVPMLVIAGHPRYATTVTATGLDLRCRGVQEFDIVPAAKSMTKYAKLVTDPLSIKKEAQYAIDMAMEGRRGPVWLSIPLDVQSALVEEDMLYPTEPHPAPAYDDPAVVLPKLSKLLQEAKRPCILTGSGIRTGGVTEAFRTFAERMGIPIIGGALLPDILHDGFPLYYGGSGSVGPRTGNFILQNADLILVLGNSLATKQTGFNQEAFAPHAKIVMVDAQHDEAFKPGLRVDMPVWMDLRRFFDAAEQYLQSISVDADWLSYCEKAKALLADVDAPGAARGHELVRASYFWQSFTRLMPMDAVIALGNSSCICGMLQKKVNTETQRVLVNYNSGSMGDDLPEAVGAAVGLGRTVFCVTGDGSVMMNLQELQTIRHYELPIKIVIFSNDGYNAIRQTHKSFFDGLYTGCDPQSGVSFPDFAKVADAFGFAFRDCPCEAEVENGLAWLFAQQGQAILQIQQILDDPVQPKVVSKMQADGTFITPPLQDMSPELDAGLMDALTISW